MPKDNRLDRGFSDAFKAHLLFDIYRIYGGISNLGRGALTMLLDDFPEIYGSDHDSKYRSRIFNQICRWRQFGKDFFEKVLEQLGLVFLPLVAPPKYDCKDLSSVLSVLSKRPDIAASHHLSSIHPSREVVSDNNKCKCMYFLTVCSR